MAEKAVLTDTVDIDPLLRRMELSRDALLAVVEYADSHRALITDSDVRGFRLITMHDKAVRGLRENFAGSKWVPDECGGQEGIKNTRLKIRVIAVNLDENAGNPDENVTPRARHIKGNSSKAKARSNGTGWLPNLPMPDPVKDKDNYKTWILGFYSNGEKRSAELSLPLGFKGGHFIDFVTRIILDDGGHSAQEAIRKGPDANPPTEIVEIPIKRK